MTYAAEKALPSVVYIKSVQNSKIQTVEYSDPFEDFFSDRRYRTQRFRPSSIAIHSRISSLIRSEVSSVVDKAITDRNASARCRRLSVLLQARVSSSRLMVTL